MTSTQGPTTDAIRGDHNDGRDLSLRATRDKGALRQRLEAEAQANGVPLKALTVLSSQRDPFRQDTPAGHRDAQWLADRVADLLGDNQKIHLRGLHYVLLGQTKPDGTIYQSSEKDLDWNWLSESAAKAARWLGYIPFDRFFDQRNGEPLIIRPKPHDPHPVLDLGGVQVELPDEIDDPRILMTGVQVRQPYKIVLHGEKSSLLPVLEPLAQRYGADLYVIAGEISDTLMYGMAKEAADDGRPMAVFSFNDCDPAGWQMPISIARKLQAMETSLFPGLQFAVYRVGLLHEHVAEYGLPSTPLKSSEKRAEAWIAAYGTEQSEIDALAALQPNLLRRIAEDAISPFFDGGLAARVWQAVDDWESDATARLTSIIGRDQLEQFRAEAQVKLESLRDEISAINSALQIDASSLDLPDLDDLPEPEIDTDMHGEPLVSSEWSFTEQCQALIDSREYRR